MKRYCNLYEKIYDIENLRMAHHYASKDKSYYKEVIVVNSSLESHLQELNYILKNQIYEIKPTDYTSFFKNDKGKVREIFKLPYFPHRIIQWAILLQTKHIFLSYFVDRTYASIDKRGIHKASHKLRNDLRKYKNETEYCYKIDIKKFYPNIDQKIMKELLRDKFKDQKLLNLLDIIVDSKGENQGLAIGSLASQWLGNYYLTKFDHWMLEEKKVHFYYRYCDDVVICSESTDELHKLKKDIHTYLECNLNLKIKENEQIFPVDIRGIDFVGYRHFRGYTLLRKSIYKNMRFKLKKIHKKCRDDNYELNYHEYCLLNSYEGWLKWCNAYNLKNKYIVPLKPKIKEYHKNHLKSNNRKEV